MVTSFTNSFKETTTQMAKTTRRWTQGSNIDSYEERINRYGETTRTTGGTRFHS